MYVIIMCVCLKGSWLVHQSSGLCKWYTKVDLDAKRDLSQLWKKRIGPPILLKKCVGTVWVHGQGLRTCSHLDPGYKPPSPKHHQDHSLPAEGCHQEWEGLIGVACHFSRAKSVDSWCSVLKLSRTPQKITSLEKTPKTEGFFTLGLAHFCWSATLKAEKNDFLCPQNPTKPSFVGIRPFEESDSFGVQSSYTVSHRRAGYDHQIIILRVLISILPVSLVEIKDYNWTSHVQASKQASRKWPVYTKKPPQIPQVKERSSPWPWSIKTFS